MTLTNDQEEDVRRKVIDQFGQEAVKQMDIHYMTLNDIRIGCRDSYEFLEKVKEKYPDHNTELLIAAILYGMKQGELAVEYHRRQQTATPSHEGKPLPKCGHAT